jgi:maleate isomerase
MTALRLGMILPSSNTVVEPVSMAMAADLPDVSVHFSRFALTAVQVANPAAAYYDSGALLGAAKLLADARCHVITWNGSAGGLVGFERDRRLCREIEDATGIPATTASLSLLDALKRAGVRRFAMVTLNTAEMNRTIADNFAREGLECVGSTDRDDITDNFAMSQVPPEEISASAISCVAACAETSAGADALIIYGTNTRGAPVARMLEKKLGIPVYDSVAWGVFGALLQVHADIRPLTRWAPHAPA